MKSELTVDQWDHPSGMHAKFPEKLTFLTRCYAQMCVRIRGKEIIAFRKILRTYYVDDPNLQILLSL